MKLDVLCDGIVKLETRNQLLPDIAHITHDSRKAEYKSIFAAIDGAVFDGNDFISHACQLGAVAILTSKPEKVPCGVPVLYAKEPRKAMALLARKLYGFPDRELEIIGVTGTNGKTTTSFILDQLLSAKGMAGRIGFLSNYTGVSEEIANRATPESSEIYQLLREMVTQNCIYASIEISSHALMMYRVWGLTLRYALFTNLTQDHLDYHKSMEAYFEAKKRIFGLLAPHGVAVLNADDPYCQKLNIQNHRVVTFGRSMHADLRFEVLELTGKNSTVRFFYLGEQMKITIALLGRHNLYNFAAAVIVALLEGVTWQQIGEKAKGLQPTPGRMESLNLGQSFDVVIDFAHTPDALANVLKSCRNFTRGQIHLVFGAGGNRDREKRPLMGVVAAEGADWIYATSDNPRNEDPLSILQEVTEPLQADCDSGKCLIIPDRSLAISKAIARAKPHDMVLIAGKGHETTQEIKGIFHLLNDREVASDMIRKRSEDGSF